MRCQLTIFVFLFVAGCQYNPFAHRFLTREPTSEEVVGQYQLTEVYVGMVDSNLGKRIRSTTPTPLITIHSDGSAILANFPFIEAQKGTLNYTFKGFENLTARWAISSVGGVSSGGNDYKTVYGLRLTLADGRRLFDSPSFTGKEQVEGMIFTLYDMMVIKARFSVTQKPTQNHEPPNHRSPSAPVVVGR